MVSKGTSSSNSATDSNRREWNQCREGSEADGDWSDHPPVAETRRPKDPRSKAKYNIFSRLLFFWLEPIFCVGCRQGLDQDDLYVHPEETDSQYLLKKFKRCWEQELEKKRRGGKARLWVAIVKCVWWRMILQAILQGAEVVLVVSQSVVLGYLVDYFSIQDPTSSETRDAYLYAAGLVLLAIAVMLTHGHGFLVGQKIGMIARICTTGAIYEKILKLSQSTVGQVTIGRVINLASNDVQRFDLAFIFIPFLLISPLHLAVFTYLVYVEVGWPAFLATGFILLQIPLQMILAKLFAAFRLKSAKVTDKRVKVMNEVITGIRVIKMYAWEYAFKRVVSMLRKVEALYILKGGLIRVCTYSFIYTSNILITMIVFIAYSATGGTLTTRTVFTTISLVVFLRRSSVVFASRCFFFLYEAGVATFRIQDLSWGDYHFEVFIEQYENPDSRRFNGRCCDGPVSSPCTDECDNQFFFCLRPIGYVQELGMDLPTTLWECPMGSAMTDVIMNSDLLQYDIDPLVFTGTDWPGGFQLATKVDDSDGSSGLEFVDIILAEEQMEVNDRFTRGMSFRGEYGSAFLHLSLRLTCTEFYSGPNCSVYCGMPGCTPERGICREMGQCECYDGYSGDFCGESGIQFEDNEPREVLLGPDTVMSLQTLSCTVTQPQEEYMWQWKYNEEFFTPENISLSDGTRTSTITIPRLSADDAGVYQCQASSPFGNSTQAITMNLTGVLISSGDVVSSQLHKSVNLTCELYGYLGEISSTVINWQQLGENSIDSSLIVTEQGTHMIQNGGDSPIPSVRSVLTLQNITNDTFGTYICTNGDLFKAVTLEQETDTLPTQFPLPAVIGGVAAFLVITILVVLTATVAVILRKWKATTGGQAVIEMKANDSYGPPVQGSIVAHINPSYSHQHTVNSIPSCGNGTEVESSVCDSPNAEGEYEEVADATYETAH